MAIVNPIDYSGGSGFLQGLKAYGGMQEIQQARMANEQAAAQQEALNAFKSDWQASFGDPQKMSALVAKYPGQMDAIKAGIGFQDEQHQMSLGNAARDLRVTMATGKPQAVQLAAVKHAGVLNSVGSSVDDITQQFQQDPNGLANIVDAVGLSALGAKDYYGVQNDRAQRQNDVAKLQEQVRSNKAGEAVQWANNNIAQQNVNLRRMELDDKKYDRQIANETNAIKLADLQDKRQQNQQAIEQAKRDKADAYNAGIDTLSRTIDTATKVLNSPGFTGYFGTNLNPLSSRHIPGTDAADTEALVDTLKSQGFMSGIQQMKGMGALSNAEGQKVMDAIGNLSASQSEKSARAAINTIISTTQRAQQRMQQKYGKDIQTQSSSQSQEQPSAAQLQPGHSEGGYTFLGGDPAKPTSWRKN
ncbi:TPA: acyltransferase [Citrobacter freundii]|nr:acyltransferase [Citrobacter freundii]HAT2226575.1 acyltransferase [Citrobacter freundii]HAT2566932.1 acyltransferase [Citrobacter freundii]HAT2587497.1 acyltransferase [Citrobacter freundii]HAT3022878.1 acyltransferase [Citrobacter freundii]